MTNTERIAIETMEAKTKERRVRRATDAYLNLPMFLQTMEVCPSSIEYNKPPMDDSGAQAIAEEIIAILDGTYNRERVFTIAKWIRYLATQG